MGKWKSRLWRFVERGRSGEEVEGRWRMRDKGGGAEFWQLRRERRRVCPRLRWEASAFTTAVRLDKKKTKKEMGIRDSTSVLKRRK